MTFDAEFRTRLLTDWKVGRHTLILAIAVEIGSSQDEVAAMVDTACGPCVIDRLDAIAAGWQPSEGLGISSISTRMGNFEGIIDRLPIKINGRDEWLSFECTWLIIEDWPGPVVLGWRGCLERMRFATEPLDNWFYFAEP